MNKPARPSKTCRASSDFVGAICFVVLGLTVLYATLTID